MVPNISPFILTDLFLPVQAYVCQVGREKDDQNAWRWILPYEDPCSCTSVIMGGVNTWTPKRPFKPTYVNTPLLSDNIDEIRAHYGIKCVGMYILHRIK